MLLGCIADDLTGATDLALMLTRAGMRTVQVMGVPGADSRARRLRCGGGGAEVAHQPGRRGRGAVARSRRGAAGARRAAAVLQVLLDVRFDRRGQHRPGGRGAAATGSVASIAIACPAFPDQQAHGLSGQSVRRRRAAGGKPDEGSPADADARFQPGARAAAADQAAGRAGAVRASSTRARPRSRAAFDRRAGRRASASSSSTPSLDRHLVDMGEAAAGHKLITGGSGVAMGLPGNFVAQGLMKAAAAPVRG